MKRWSISNALLATTFAACLIALPQTEGCGWHQTHILALAISPDSQVLAVSRMDARKQERFYNNDFQTVSLLKAGNGQVEKVLKRGRMFPLDLFELDSSGSSRLQFTAECLYVRDSREGLLVFDHQGKSLSTHSFKGPLRQFAVSTDDQSILYYSLSTPAVNMSSASDRQVRWSLLLAQDYGWSGRVKLKISGDRCAILEDDRAVVANCETGEVLFEKLLKREEDLKTGIYLARQNSLLIVQYPDGYGLLDLDSRKQTWNEDRLLTVSDNGRFIVTDSDSGIQIRDLERDVLVGTLDLTAVIACVSADGKLLYASAGSGVSCYDTASGRRLWSRAVPGRYRPSWIWPAGIALLCAWPRIRKWAPLLIQENTLRVK